MKFSQSQKSHYQRTWRTSELETPQPTWPLAYIVELEEDVAESSNVNDIPTTIIRSKQDIAAGAASAASLSNSTNDIVINKLTQILSYLRAGKNLILLNVLIMFYFTN